jgi:hypothetical protein
MFRLPVKPFLLRHQILSGGETARLRQQAALATIGICLLGVGCTNAGGSGVRSAATTIGWATTAPEPKDFVIARRSGSELSYVPIGRGGVERPVVQRNTAAVRDLETQLDQNRDASENFARRQLPGGAYGQPLPSVAAPPRPQAASAARPASGSPDSYPVNPNRLRQIRENSRQVTDQ